MQKRSKSADKSGKKTKSNSTKKKNKPFPEFTMPMEALDEIGIRVSVSGDASLSGKVERCVTEELKTVPDIIVTDRDPDFWIDIVCQHDNSNGFCLSYFIATMLPMPEEEVADDLYIFEKEMVTDFMNKLCSIFIHQIKVGPMDTLEDASKEIAREFEENLLDDPLVWHNEIGADIL